MKKFFHSFVCKSPLFLPFFLGLNAKCSVVDYAERFSTSNSFFGSFCWKVRDTIIQVAYAKHKAQRAQPRLQFWIFTLTNSDISCQNFAPKWPKMIFLVYWAITFLRLEFKRIKMKLCLIIESFYFECKYINYINYMTNEINKG